MGQRLEKWHRMHLWTTRLAYIGHDGSLQMDRISCTSSEQVQFEDAFEAVNSHAIHLFGEPLPMEEMNDVMLAGVHSYT